MKWLGLCGRAGSGKDWLCRELANHGLEVNKVSIAAAIKSILIALNPKIEGKLRLRDLPEGIDEAKWIYPEVRRLLQRLGTQGGRATLGEDVWINAALRLGKPGALNVVTDIRFQNEIDILKAAGGRVVKVERPGSPFALQGDVALHASERLVAGLLVDHVYYNTPSKDQALHDLVSFIESY